MHDFRRIHLICSHYKALLSVSLYSSPTLNESCPTKRLKDESNRAEPAFWLRCEASADKTATNAHNPSRRQKGAPTNTCTFVSSFSFPLVCPVPFLAVDSLICA